MEGINMLLFSDYLITCPPVTKHYLDNFVVVLYVQLIMLCILIHVEICLLITPS
jgi:hypothetical protein